MVFIIFVCVVYCIYATVDSVFMLLNDYVDDYYAWVILIFFIPLYGATLMFSAYVMSDSREKRQSASWALLAILCVIIWYLIWAIVYFEKLYSEPVYYKGYGTKDDKSNYEEQPKRVMIFYTVLIAALWIAIFLYFFL